PLKQIATNAGLEAGVVADKVANLEPGFGLNAVTGGYEGLLAAGINDPAKGTRSALQNAASIAGLFLTTESVGADKPEKAAAGADAAAATAGRGGRGCVGFRSLPRLEEACRGHPRSCPGPPTRRLAVRRGSGGTGAYPATLIVMSFTGTDSCGNSPKNLFVARFEQNLFNGDRSALAEVVADDCVLQIVSAD